MKPSDPTAAPRSLPTWTVAPLLGGLIGVAGLIALVGWLIVHPAPKPSRPAAVAEIKPPPDAVPPSTAPAEPVLHDEPPPEVRRRESFDLPRRRGVESPDPTPPVVVAEPTHPKAHENDPPQEKKPEPKAPIHWTSGSKGPGANLILPIEIAKIDCGPLHFSLRRLRFPDGAPKQLRLAVTPQRYDDMASLLTQMGPGYRFTNIQNIDTYSYDKLKAYDVLFLTCSEVFAQDFQSVGPLRRFVEMGGTLYASDLRGELLQSAFSDFRARTPILPGIPQHIEASVIDQGLQNYLGRKTIPLTFESSGWRPAAFDPSKVTVCLRGVYRNNLGKPATVPLMVKFRVKRGTVIFTSFHNSRNDSEIVKKVLEYLVFSSINARSEARLKELMHQSNFTAQDVRPVAVSKDKPAEAVHQHPGGGLQIALGFENLGARLKLTLHSPSGRTFEHEDQGLYLIEVPKAEPGAWRYTVTPLELPYQNFPIVVAVGVMKS